MSVDVGVGCSFGAQAEGGFDDGDEVFVWYPAVQDVGGSVSTVANIDGFSFEAEGGNATQCAKFVDVVG